MLDSVAAAVRALVCRSLDACFFLLPPAQTAVLSRVLFRPQDQQDGDDVVAAAELASTPEVQQHCYGSDGVGGGW